MASKQHGRVKTRGRKPKPTRRTFLLVSVFLFASGILRLGADVESAFARQSLGDQTQAAEAPVAKAGACDPAPEIATVLEALGERETRLKEREARLEKRMQALSISEGRVKAEIEKLEKAENALRKTISVADGAAENDITKLIAVYEKMKPKDAAALFEKMEPRFSAGFLGRMKPEVAAGILAGLSSDRAYAVSAILAGQNLNAPTE